jgi:hypothetical protein
LYVPRPPMCAGPCQGPALIPPQTSAHSATHQRVPFRGVAPILPHTSPCPARGQSPPATRAGDMLASLRHEGRISPGDVVGGHCMHPECLSASLDRSLASLGLGSVDLLYIHNPAESQLRQLGREAFMQVGGSARRARWGAFGFLETCTAWARSAAAAWAGGVHAGRACPAHRGVSSIEIVHLQIGGLNIRALHPSPLHWHM